MFLEASPASAEKLPYFPYSKGGSCYGIEDSTLLKSLQTTV